MSLVLELPKDVELWLRNKAEEMKISPEVFAVSILEEATLRKVDSELSDEEFALLARGVIDDNRELLERLA